MTSISIAPMIAAYSDNRPNETQQTARGPQTPCSTRVVQAIWICSRYSN